MELLSYIPLLGWIYGIYFRPELDIGHFHGCQALAILLFYLGIASLGAVYSILIPPNLLFLIPFGIKVLILAYILTLLVAVIGTLIFKTGELWFFSKIAKRLPF